MEQERPQDQPLERMIEQPDLDALRGSYKGPSRARLRVERAISSVGRALTNKTFLTVFLAIAIVIVLVIGYMQLS